MTIAGAKISKKIKSVKIFRVDYFLKYLPTQVGAGAAEEVSDDDLLIEEVEEVEVEEIDEVDVVDEVEEIEELEDVVDLIVVVVVVVDEDTTGAVLDTEVEGEAGVGLVVVAQFGRVGTMGHEDPPMSWKPTIAQVLH